MSTTFAFPLLNLPIPKLYEAFSKFRAHEEFIHPRDKGYSLHEQYWGPAYSEIEEAYAKNDEQKFKQGLTQLIDKILHD